jgi:hypothetical protein
VLYFVLREKRTGFWCENLKEKEHLEKPSIGGRIMVTSVIKKYNGTACNGFIWLKIGTSSEGL